jgi:hypothetical protein
MYAYYLTHRSLQVIEDHISPAIYRLVTKYFGEHYDSASFEEYCHDADMWISCWVGCANILVQNRKKACFLFDGGDYVG